MTRNLFILVGVLQLVACSGGSSGGDSTVGGSPSTTQPDSSGGSSQAGGSKATSKTTKNSGGSPTTSKQGSGGEDSSGGVTSASSKSPGSNGGTESSSRAATGGKSNSTAAGGKSGTVAAGGTVATGGKSGSVTTGGTMSGDGGASRGGTSSTTTTTAAGNEEWVPSWATTIQRTETSNLPPALGGNTLRQFVWPTLSGSKIRIQLSNERGNGPVEIKKVHIAMAKGTDSTASSGGIDTATDKEFLFKGAAAVTIPKGETVWSDELAFELQEVKLTAISMQFGTTVPSDVTGHPGARTTSYVASGDAIAKENLSGGQTRERWYFIDAIEVMAPPDVVAIAAFGDSITDGYGVKNAFSRWPDYLTTAIKKDATLANKRTVLDFGMGANNLTVSGADQDSGLVRFERDVLKRDKVKYVVLLQGINDILYSNVQAQAIIDAFKQVMTKAKAKGIKVYGSPILPQGGPNDQSKIDAAKDTIRKTVNKSVRTGNIFDLVIDFEKLLGGKEDASTFLSQYAGDAPHPNIAGYEAMGNFVDLSLFK